MMQLSIDLDREEDGRWIAEVLELPGVMVYGSTRDEAIGAVERLAVEVVADRVAHGELPNSSFNLAFIVKDEQLAGI
jgi:predicted RNase H-like HicB family nuclease